MMPCRTVHTRVKHGMIRLLIERVIPAQELSRNRGVFNSLSWKVSGDGGDWAGPFYSSYSSYR